MKKYSLALFVAFYAFASSVFAAVPADVTTALTDAKADSITVAGLALIIIVAVTAFKYMRKGL